jgi:Yip1 domain.
MAELISEAKQVWHVLFHPFDGFYDVKFVRKKTYALAFVILFLYGISGILSYQYTGFILNYNPLFEMNSFVIFATTLFPLLLFLISNWSVTALFDGSGSLGDIFIVICYSLVPKLVFDLLGVALSNVVVREEAALLYALVAVGTVWFCFLLFCGLCVIHEYTVLTNVVTLIATFCAAVVIVFLAMMYFTLLAKVIGFVDALFAEWSRRW